MFFNQLQTYIFVTFNTQSHIKGYSRPNKYFSEFEKPFYTLMNLDSEKSILRIFVFFKAMMTGMILIDLQKAFDTTDHVVLGQKLYAIGFSKHTVN